MHMIFNVFKSAHNCEMEMQHSLVAVIQLSEALSFRHLSCDNMFTCSYPVEIGGHLLGNALIRMCTC